MSWLFGKIIWLAREMAVHVLGAIGGVLLIVGIIIGDWLAMSLGAVVLLIGLWVAYLGQGKKQ